MRISSNMIYQKGVGAMQLQTANLLHTQQQVSTGRRILTPADDPIASARALELGQSRSINQQFQQNIAYAGDNLRLLEGKLSGIEDMIQYNRERIIQAGNDALSDTDLGFIASDLRAQFDSLLAIGNTRDGQGEYLFAGYKSQQQPFVGGLNGVSYAGDQGERSIQVSASRFMPISAPGEKLFNSVSLANGGLYGFNGQDNTGSGSVSLSYNPAPPDPATLGRRYEVSFDGANYTVTELQRGNPTPVAVTTGPGPTLSLPGVDLTVAGAPAAGDSFEVMVASTNVFDNAAMFIDALERPGSASMTDMVAFGLNTTDAFQDATLTFRAQVGAQLGELDQLNSLGEDLDLQYADTISRLEDLDYVEAISRLTQQQTYLQAAQQSFMRVSNLSLFNFLN